MLQDVAIDIQDGRIRSITPLADVAEAPLGTATELDLRSFTILPGLIDAHVHLWGARDAAATEPLTVSHERRLIRAAVDAETIVRSGVTTVRCMGSAFSIAIRDAIDSGEILGPRVIAAGRGISQTGGHGDMHFLPLDWAQQVSWSVMADGVPECLRAVRGQLRDGADVIKVSATGGASSMRDRPEHRQFTPEELEAIVDEAHAWDRKVAAHAVSQTGIRNAVHAGVDTIEHGHHLDDEVCDVMLDAGVFLVPTLMAGHRNVTLGSKLGAAPWRVAKSTQHHEAHLRSFELALARGVPIVCGSDNLGPRLRPHGSTHEELALFVNHGMTPGDAIRAATVVAARALGLENEVGTIAPGMTADMIAVAGDPLSDIGVLANVQFVMARGAVIQRA
jgi:imidazolonepropionase-like amidohydrolase